MNMNSSSDVQYFGGASEPFAHEQCDQIGWFLTLWATIQMIMIMKSKGYQTFRKEGCGGGGGQVVSASFDLPPKQKS